MSNNHSPYHYVRPEVIPLLDDGKLFSQGPKAPTRAAFAQTVIELGETNPDVVVLDADVSKSIGTNQFGARSLIGISTSASPSRTCSPPPPVWPPRA